MTWVETARPAGEQSAWASDAPAFIGRNELRYQFSGTTPRWTNETLPDFSDPDRTSALFPVDLAWDGQGELSTFGIEVGSHSTWHFLLELNLAEVDTVLCVFDAPHGGSTVSVEFALGNNPTFGSEATLGLFTGVNARSGDSTLRMLALADDVYTTARYFRATFTMAVGTSTSPRISELFVGRRRQISRQWEYGGDDEPYGGISDLFEGRARGLVNYARAYGFSDFEYDYRPAGGLSDMFGLDDVETWRQIARDSRGGMDPLVFIPFPWTSTTAWSASGESGRIGSEGFFGLVPPGLFLPKRGPFERDGHFSFLENPPFYRVET